jgi:hypothetical protein
MTYTTYVHSADGSEIPFGAVRARSLVGRTEDARTCDEGLAFVFPTRAEAEAAAARLRTEPRFRVEVVAL